MNARQSYIEIMLAWRNVWKNKRRTILTLLTIMVGCAMIFWMRAIQEGFYAQMIEDAVSANTGHIQIHEKGFNENLSIDYAFIPGAAVNKKLKSSDFIQAFSQRIHAAGLVTSGSSMEGVLIQAVDPVSEQKVTNIHRSILKGGRYLNQGDRKNIIIGETLARNLGVKVGDSVSILSQGFDGSIAALHCVAIGLFKSGNPEYDRLLIIMPISQAREMFTMADYVSSIVIRLKDGRTMEQVRDDLRNTIGNKSLEIMGYDELLPDMMQYIVFDRVTGEIIYWILFLVVAFGVLNTIQMSVYERIREFGVMLAIGTRPAQIRKMVLIESMIISVAGILLGVLLGTALSWYLILYPLDYSEFSKEIAEWGFSTFLVSAKLELFNYISTPLITLVLSMLFTISPARRASRLNPIQAIRKL
jgi:putative ABC transport system permease protein